MSLIREVRTRQRWMPSPALWPLPQAQRVIYRV